jgi:hypothetical protein
MIMDGGDKPMMTTYLPKIAFTFQTRFKYSQGRNKRDTDSTLKGKKRASVEQDWPQENQCLLVQRA